METMYDRLGELLNQTLEAGEVRFVSTAALHEADAISHATSTQSSTSTHTEAQSEGVQGDSSRTRTQAHSRMNGSAQGMDTHSDARGAQGERGHTAHKAGGRRKTGGQTHTKARAQKGGANSARAKTSEFRQFAAPRITTMNEEQMRALRLLGLTPTATVDDVKRAYKEKLKYFHPDKYDNNEVLKTVATKKTRMIVEAYELLCKHFAPKA